MDGPEGPVGAILGRDLGVVFGPLLANTVSSVDIQLPFLISGGLFILLAIWVFALRGIDRWHGEPTAMITSRYAG